MLVGQILPTLITSRVLENEWSRSTALFIDTVSLKLKCDHQMCRFTRLKATPPGKYTVVAHKLKYGLQPPSTGKFKIANSR
jgi:hypothetical protein